MKNIILITVDSLRSDFLTPYNPGRPATPFLARLAEEGILFENAYAAGLWTDPAVTSMYTGAYPSNHRILAGSDTTLKLDTLADRLKGAGYVTLMTGAGSDYLSERRAITKGFQSRIDTFDINDTLKRPWRLMRPSRFRTQSQSLLVNLVVGRDCRIDYSIRKTEGQLGKVDGRPLFLHLHIWFLNAWYAVPWPWKWRYLYGHPNFDLRLYRSFYGKVKALRRIGRRISHHHLCYPEVLTAEDMEMARLLYEASVYYMDRRLEGFFRWLQVKGFLEDGLLVVASDHGEMLGEHHLLGHNFSAYEPVVRIPLLAWSSAFSARREAAPVSQVEIADTIIKFADLDAPLNPRSRNLFDLAKAGDRPVFFEDGRPGPIRTRLREINPDVNVEQWDYAVKGVVSGNMKCVVRSNGAVRLFDLDNDPAEEHDLAAEDPERAEALKRLINEQLGPFNSESPVGI